MFTPAQPAPPPIPAPPAAAQPSTPCVPTARACIDLSARRAWLTDGAGHVPMPWSVFFASGVATQGGSTTASSNGCVHLTPQAAERFYDGLQNGDTVQAVP